MFRVFSDVHRGGPNPIDVTFKHGKHVIYLGDNFEMKNIPEEDVGYRLRKLKEFMIQARNHGSIVVDGNHTMRYGVDVGMDQEVFIPELGLLILHGDKALNPDYALWRNMEGGKSKKVIFALKIKNKAVNLWKKFKKSKKQKYNN